RWGRRRPERRGGRRRAGRADGRRRSARRARSDRPPRARPHRSRPFPGEQRGRRARPPPVSVESLLTSCYHANTMEPRHWPTKEHRDLFETVASLRTRDEAQRFLRDLCTRAELDAMAHRWQVAQLLDEGLPYLEVAKKAHASTTTVTRVAQWLKQGEGGYRLALQRRRES